jgi:hypothetical protein
MIREIAPTVPSLPEQPITKESLRKPVVAANGVIASRVDCGCVPAHAGIQYAAAFRLYHNCSGILDHPLARVMTVQPSAVPTPVRSRRSLRA